jgi:hypothetical protein
MKVLYYRIALIVSIANDFITQSSPEILDRNGISEESRPEIELYRIEARYLRALAYWHTLDMFRNVPLVTSISAGFPTQSTPEELFTFIKTELEEVEAALPAPRENEYGRVDKAAVWMLQAKLFLNAESMIGQNYYNESLEACKKVIDGGYTLEPVYEELFMKDNHLSNEIIFALNSDGKRSQSWGCTTFLVYAAIGGEMVAADYGASGGWAGLRTTSAMLDKFPDLTGDIDSRALFFTPGQSLEINDIGEFTDGIAVPKFQNRDKNGVAGSDPTHVDTDYPMFRLADAYLMYAECVLRGATGGDMSLAVSYVNQLRERAYGDASGNIDASGLTLPFILDERVRELYWEATRRIDLIRFGQYTGDQYIWPWKGGIKEGMATDAHRDIFPIPASDLLANPNLIQNDGY